MLRKLIYKFGSIRSFTQLQPLKQHLSQNRYPYVLVYFTAKWNPTCNISNQHIKLINYNFDKIEIIQIDSDVSPKIAKHYHVKAQPQFVLCLNGDEVVRQTGVNKEGLLQKCKKLLQGSPDLINKDKWRPFGTSFNQFYKIKTNSQANK